MGKQAPKGKGKRDTGIWWVIGVVVLGAAAFVAISMWGGDKSKTKTIAAKSDAEVHADRNTKGSKTAKVEIVEWGDYL